MALVPFDNRDGVIWMDGALRPWNDARIHVCTHALHYGSAVFEGQRVYDNHLFKCEEHTERLFESARLLGFEIPYSLDQINAAIQETVTAQGFRDGYVRPIAWRGSGQMGVSAPHAGIHVAIATWDWPSYFDAETKMKGIKLEIARWRRPDPRTSPCHSKAVGLYMICTMAKEEAEGRGFADALMFDWRDQVAEATGANVFFVKGQTIYTPTPDCFLDGITRRSVIGLARQRGFEIVERAIFPSELEEFEQCFLCGTAAEVTPVGEIGPYRFEVGAVTRQLVQDYDDLVHRRIALSTMPKAVKGEWPKAVMG